MVGKTVTDRPRDSGSVPTTVDPEWYRKIWTLDILAQPWVEQTASEVDFIVEALGLQGCERVLDLACGFGRHALELARRGHSVVGVDVTAEYIEEACRRARQGRLDAEFVCSDVRDVSFCGEFDVVLSLADGAIGYLETEAENLRIFDVIASALKPGGKHLMTVCNAAYARSHFPRRHWEAGEHAISLADFDWDDETCRMAYTSYTLKYGEALAKPEGRTAWIRLYTLEELRDILRTRGMTVQAAYGEYDMATPLSDDRLALIVRSLKV